MALTEAEGSALARLAAETVEAALRGLTTLAAPPGSAALAAPGASFVTLEATGELRGCVGTIEPARPLYLDVVRNAERAMRDPRLPPVTVADWPKLDVKVSVLGPLQPLPAATAAELARALRPHESGVLITDGQRRATYLPAVWEKLPDPESFVASLLAKGGWPAGPWPAGMRAWSYTSAEYRDAGPRDTITA
jgi:AmmeMemoRadiSam system protein A